MEEPKPKIKDPNALATLLAMGSMMTDEPRPMGNHRYCKGPITKGDPKKRKARKATKKARRKNRR